MRALRFYEQKGPLKSSRASSMVTAPRVYDEEDRTCLAEILDLTKMGFTLAEIAGGNIADGQYRQRPDMPPSVTGLSLIDGGKADMLPAAPGPARRRVGGEDE